jgi:hypothetical protein
MTRGAEDSFADTQPAGFDSTRALIHAGNACRGRPQTNGKARILTFIVWSPYGAQRAQPVAEVLLG